MYLSSLESCHYYKSLVNSKFDTIVYEEHTPYENHKILKQYEILNLYRQGRQNVDQLNNILTWVIEWLKQEHLFQKGQESPK